MEPYELNPYYVRNIICADEFLAISIGYSDKIRDNEDLNKDLFDKYETVVYCGKTYTCIKHCCTIHMSVFNSYYPVLVVFIYSSQKEYNKDRLMEFEKAVKIAIRNI